METDCSLSSCAREYQSKLTNVRPPYFLQVIGRATSHSHWHHATIDDSPLPDPIQTPLSASSRPIAIQLPPTRSSAADGTPVRTPPAPLSARGDLPGYVSPSTLLRVSVPGLARVPLLYSCSLGGATCRSAISTALGDPLIGISLHLRSSAAHTKKLSPCPD